MPTLSSSSRSSMLESGLAGAIISLPFRLLVSSEYPSSSLNGGSWFTSLKGVRYCWLPKGPALLPRSGSAM